MGINVDNCPRCGRLFAKAFREVCQVCTKEIEMEYDKCLQYLREEKTATIQETSEATGVSIKQITKFIKEGRISVANNPNMSYPCEVCGILIREGNMCDSCRQRLTRDLRTAQEEVSNQAQQQANHASRAYGVVDKFRKN